MARLLTMKSPLNRPGIYTITFPTGARYVGSAINIRLRWHGHKAELRHGTHGNSRLQRSWNCHGEGNALFSVLIFCSKDNLLLYEQLAINALSPGLNICLVAGSALGTKWTPEARSAASARMTGRKHSDETKAKMSESRMGHPTSEETKAKLALQKGWKHGDDAKNKMKGRVVGPETRTIISQAKKGNQNRKGAVIPPSMRAQISAKLKGRQLPLSTRRKMSAARRRKMPGQLNLF